MAEQPELVRVVRGADGRLAVGRGLPGRGAWLCAGSRECFELARRRRSFGRALASPVSADDVEALGAALFGPPPPGASSGPADLPGST